MSSNTPNLGLLKKDPMVDGNETFNIETMLNENWDKVDEAVGRTGGYGVTTQPKANEYEVNLKPAPASLTAGIRVTVKINVASTGAPMLNVNGLGSKPVLKTSGSSASFKQDGVYTLVYDGQAFILQGEGGEVGTATAADVLAPKTIGTDNGIVTGTIPTQGNQFKSGLWSNPDGDAYVDTYVNIDSGFYPPGSQVTIQAHDPDLLSGNIRSGVNIFGVPGKSTVVDTADAVLDPNMLVAGYSGYDDGVKKAGQMPNRSAENNHMPGLESTVWPGDRFFIKPPHGYYNGATWVTAAVPGLTANNLRAGIEVRGLVGTLSPGGRSLVHNNPMPKNISAPNTWVYHDLFIIPPSESYIDVYTAENNNIVKMQALTMTNEFITTKTAALVLIDDAGVVYTLKTRTATGAEVMAQLTGFALDRRQRTGIMYEAGMSLPSKIPMPSIPANFKLTGTLRFCSASMYQGSDSKPVAEGWARDLVVLTT
ncbi:hypothetical protein [Paenibacillus sp. MDMC362]|uniref:hypothetical protein n=1 Tax=Paenibacillus sp. MDMC362 TaxID=2977365 RepID=UPI000DC5A459|nr:hypothetical protein [Paenibacillus sp. MDMC362]RAR41950.1 hypothetical protein DP091_20535 [Paenibacillus sp. MDMC362]